MWNVFDTTFIVITALYLILRLKGLSSGDSESYFIFTSNRPLIWLGRYYYSLFVWLGLWHSRLWGLHPLSKVWWRPNLFRYRLTPLVRLAFFMVSNNVVILYVFRSPSFMFHVLTMPILVALSVLWQPNSYSLCALLLYVSQGCSLLSGLSLPRDGLSGLSLGLWYRFGLGIPPCRLVRRRLSIHVSFTTIQSSVFWTRISFWAYIDGCVCRLE